MTGTDGSRSRGGTPRAAISDRQLRLRKIAAGVGIGLGCTTMAAATIGAGLYFGTAHEAFANTSDETGAITSQTITAQSIVEKNALAFAARYPLPDTHFAPSRGDDTNANPTLAFSIPASAQVPPRAGTPAKPRLVSLAMFNDKDAKAADTKPQQAGVRLASLGPVDIDIAPQDDARATRTAIYDITAQALYMPDGEKLEAHSGWGEFMDNPRHVHRRMRGATPPNAYKLTMREAKFHGVEAVRMNPENDDAMMGRAGILVHPYMLGPTGQSNGCISLKEYGKFLAAFKRGEVDRIVVVSRLDQPPAAYARANPIAAKWTAFLQKIF